MPSPNRITHRISVLARICLVGALAWGAAAAELRELKVLYIGNATSERAVQFKTFLSTNVAMVEMAERTAFDPVRARQFDVALVDWSQADSRGQFPPRKSPLGPLSEWRTPTVLLGSAGLHVAIVWDVKGGFG